MVSVMIRVSFKVSVRARVTIMTGLGKYYVGPDGAVGR